MEENPYAETEDFASNFRRNREKVVFPGEKLHEDEANEEEKKLREEEKLHHKSHSEMIKEVDHLRKMQASIAKKRLSLDKDNMTDEDREQRSQLFDREQSISEYIDKLLNRWNDR